MIGAIKRNTLQSATTTARRRRVTIWSTWNSQKGRTRRRRRAPRDRRSFQQTDGARSSGDDERRRTPPRRRSRFSGQEQHKTGESGCPSGAGLSVAKLRDLRRENWVDRGRVPPLSSLAFYHPRATSEDLRAFRFVPASTAVAFHRPASRPPARKWEREHKKRSGRSDQTSGFNTCVFVTSGPPPPAPKTLRTFRSVRSTQRSTTGGRAHHFANPPNTQQTSLLRTIDRFGCKNDARPPTRSFRRAFGSRVECCTRADGGGARVSDGRHKPNSFDCPQSIAPTGTNCTPMTRVRNRRGLRASEKKVI